MSTILLDRLMEPLTDCLTKEAAQKIADLRLDDEAQSHLDDLATKANRGLLTPAEKDEYDQFLAAFHFITVLQSHARQILRA